MWTYMWPQWWTESARQPKRLPLKCGEQLTNQSGLSGAISPVFSLPSLTRSLIISLPFSSTFPPFSTDHFRPSVSHYPRGSVTSLAEELPDACFYRKLLKSFVAHGDVSTGCSRGGRQAVSSQDAVHVGVEDKT